MGEGLLIMRCTYLWFHDSSEKVIYIRNVIRKACDATVSRHRWAWSCRLSILMHSPLYEPFLLEVSLLLWCH